MQRIITDDLDLLLDALPRHICEPLRQRDDNFELLEIVMDLGRRPEARYPGREVVLALTEVTSEDIDYVVPDQTILIQNPVAITTDSANPQSAQAFLDYEYTPEAQKLFADNGYRPVVAGVVPADQFPTPSSLFTIADLGGWPDVATKFFDTKTGIVAAIEQANGVAVASK